ncbi:hypothetical protein [Oceanicoccus sp. KOV_DT_Chl]|uniref:hypothetical protein n=1 Tax=Oceanicoccus sp. KOV_DT_Chl TaxID=1904639 RepID=UPI000C7BB4AC|nr:hypothetical protein [Oceanicoccus sp. KOV_DT_Chl]
MSSQHAIKGNFLHPCVIDGKDTLVHANDLQHRDPAFYQQLQHYAAQNHYTLVADRRSQDKLDQSGRRKAWLPVMVLSLGLNTAVAASDRNDTHSSAVHYSQSQSVLALLHPSADGEHTTDRLHDHQGESLLESGGQHEHFEFEIPASPEAEQLEDILQQHYTASAQDPDHIQYDLTQMARYLSQYPEAVELIQALAEYPWRLSYAENTFETEVRGTPFQVQAVNIRFDSRAAAQLRSHKACKTQANACIASPADALLHELLHAKAALLETKQFIAQGGMNSILYPYEHERAVIQHENSIYQAMSDRDGVMRPQRFAHAGRLVASSCSFCIN